MHAGGLILSMLSNTQNVKPVVVVQHEGSRTFLTIPQKGIASAQLKPRHLATAFESVTQAYDTLRETLRLNDFPEGVYNVIPG